MYVCMYVCMYVYFLEISFTSEVLEMDLLLTLQEINNSRMDTHTLFNIAIIEQLKRFSYCYSAFCQLFTDICHLLSTFIFS